MTSQSLNSTSNSEEPEAYAIGHVPFLGTTIWLDSRPLIPRTETEFWVECAIVEIQKQKRPSVLDLFAGSGCVGVAVLQHVPQALVDFGELEARHIPTIEKNIRENDIDPSRAKVIQTDVYSNITGPYDFILANPPYLSTERLARIEPSVLAHEPREALFAGDDGFKLIQKTLDGLPTLLNPGGQCWIEHEPEHAPRIPGGTVHKDQYGLLRYSVILHP